MTRRTVPDAVIEAQRRAAAPMASAWVSANAGSGKTTVLARRVVRLLLAGAHPARLLCLTFTKAAAANMQLRVFNDLAAFATMPDEALGTALFDLEGQRLDAAALGRARRLFAAAIETPGGLKFLTIHAFCEKVLRVFPFEANVPAGFEILDEATTRDLLDEAREAVLREALTQPGGRLAMALATLVEETGEDGFARLMTEVARRRRPIAELIAARGGADAAADALGALLGLLPGETAADVEASIFEGGLPRAEWPAIAAALREAGMKSDIALAGSLESAFAAEDDETRLEAYLSVFLTGKGEPRAERSFITAATRRAHPSLTALMKTEQARIVLLVERRKAALAQKRSRALLHFAEAMIERYQAGKSTAGALDFDDLVHRTVALLERAGADWVLFKLDQGIDHILVDEAQDTSPEQWRIVGKLAEEFMAGAGARTGLARTIFAVGDEKQSIFSFQGAAPAAFAQMRRHFAGRLRDARLVFEDVRLDFSFRSTSAVLSAVDVVFADPSNRRGLTDEDVATFHQSVRGADPGIVEVWPVEAPLATPSGEAWDAPFDTIDTDAPVARLARRIALAIRGWTSGPAAIDPGEVMVLVRSRGPIFQAVIRALKQAGVPVAGADRLVLTEHIAAMDLMVLARFVLRPEDDLALATLLKTPLIGFDDDDLIRLAPHRPGSLFDALRADHDARSIAAVERLARWIDEAPRRSPFAFFAGVLARDGGRRAMLARLGLEAAEALDEFLTAARDFEARATPTLQGFLAHLDATRLDVKRDMDMARGEVRVMTVHGAKGLEARIVVLADTCTAPSGRHDAKLFFLPDPAAAAFAPELLVWARDKDNDPAPVAQHRQHLRELAAQEHRRLLYVAMTRAADRLVVAGFDTGRSRPEDAWWDMVEGSLRRAGARVEPMPDGSGDRLVWPSDAVEPVGASPAPARAPVSTVVPWLARPAPAERPDVVALTPSAAQQAPPVLPGATLVEGWALLRGRLVHRLLQALPEIAGDRLEAARRFLARAAPDHADEHDGLIASVLAILDAPSFAPVFAPGSRAEVPIVGRLVRAGRADLLVSGRVDRIVVTADRVLVIDFKTNETVPGSLAEAPPGYIAQLALYRAVLARLFPVHRIEAALAFTNGPLLMPLPGALLDAALAEALAG